MMDGVRWSTSRSQESFSRSTTAADTLSRLASFIARADTRQHTQNPQEPSHLPLFVCQECGKGFTYATDLLKHQELKHTLPKPHRCLSCGQEFSLKSSLQLHKCNQDSTRCECCHVLSRLGSPCPACTTRISNARRLPDKSLHRQPHLVDSSPYACAPCGRSFSQKQALLHHQQAGCSEPPSPSNTPDASSLPFDSPPVSEGHSARSDISDIPGPSSRVMSACQTCARTFRTEAALQRHKQNNHAEEKLMPKEDSDCDEERVERPTKVNGASNEKPNSKNKLLSCRSCDMVFKSTSKLYMHRKEKHSREKKMMMRRESRPAISKRRRGDMYPCQVCSKVFFHHLSLRAHYRRHAASRFNTITDVSQLVGCSSKDFESSEKRPNKGSETGKAAPGRPRKVPRVLKNTDDPGRVSNIKEEQEKDFPCPSCAEVFSLQQQLKEHVELHQSSVRKRQCSVCTNEMDSRKWLGSKRQRLYHCVPCQQGFSALDSFLEHCQEHLRVRVEEDRISECYMQQTRKV